MLGLLAALFNVQVAAQTQPDPLERTVAVSVTDDRGEVVKGLTADRFRARSAGPPIQIVSALDSVASRVVILFDTGGSMGGVNHLPPLLVVKEFEEQISADTQLTVLTFASRIEDRTVLSLDRAPAQVELRKLEEKRWGADRPRGMAKSAILDAIVTALDLLSPPRPGDAVALITDNDDDASHVSLGEARRRLHHSGVRLFGFILAFPLGNRLVEPGKNATATYFADLSTETGGDAVVWDSMEFAYLTPKDLSQRKSSPDFRLQRLLNPTLRLSREASDFYCIKIRLSAPIDRPRNWKLEVVDPATGKPDHHLVLHYPSQLFPVPNGGP